MKKLFITLALASCVALAGCGEYSTGNRAGVVVKFSEKGFVCKTWEGEMQLGGANGVAVATTFAFTVEDPAVADKINAALASGNRVQVQYRQEWLASPCRTGTKGDYFVVSVK